MRHRGGNKKSFAVGALFGGLVGGVTALLFAPKSGEKMRKDLAKKYEDVSDRTQDLFEEVCDQSSELIEKAKDIACIAKSAAKKIYRD